MKGDAIVIGGGSTIDPEKVRDLRSWGVVIGVNDSAIHAHVDAAITMDRLWLEYRWNDLVKLYTEGQLKLIFARKGIAKNIPGYDRSGVIWFDNVNKSENIMSRTAWNFNGSNSGVCGISLAANGCTSDRTRRIFLLGFDMKQRDGKAYWYPPYPWAPVSGATKPGKYRAWAKEFGDIVAELAKANIEIYNVTHDSAIPLNLIEQISFKKFMGMIRGY